MLPAVGMAIHAGQRESAGDGSGADSRGREHYLGDGIGPRQHWHQRVPPAVGGYIALAGIWAATISGASMNPVRSPAPDLVRVDLSITWVYRFTWLDRS
jgi:hypothetical protein